MLKPGGQLRYLEHVRANTPGLARLQHLLDVIWPALFGGCHLGRDTTTAIAQAGFTIDKLDDCDLAGGRAGPGRRRSLGQGAPPGRLPTARYGSGRPTGRGDQDARRAVRA